MIKAGKAPLGDPAAMVIVGRVVRRSAGARHQRGVHLLAMLGGERKIAQRDEKYRRGLKATSDTDPAHAMDVFSLTWANQS